MVTQATSILPFPKSGVTLLSEFYFSLEEVSLVVTFQHGEMMTLF